MAATAWKAACVPSPSGKTAPGRSFRLAPPGVKGGAFGEEFVGELLADAGFAGAVGDGSDAVRNFVDKRAQRRVVGGGGQDDAVAIERGVFEGVIPFEGLVERDGAGVGQAKMRENVARGTEKPFAVVGGVVDGVERQCVAAANQQIRVLEHGPGPMGGGDQFGGANAAVPVRVNQRGRARVKIQPGNRAGQRDPKFLVQFVKMNDVGAGFDLDLVKTAGAVKPPAMRDCGGGHNLWGGERREARGGDRLADPPAFFIRQMELDAFGQRGKLLAQCLPGGFEQDLAAGAVVTRPRISASLKS